MRTSLNYFQTHCFFLITFFCLSFYSNSIADVCSITNIRLGGQPGDAYIGPTCNNDGTYRTCLYVSGVDLPAQNPSYQVRINGVLYPIAFTVALSSTEVVVCVTGVPGDGTPNVSVSVQLAQGCSFFKPNLFTEPICVCTITSIRLGGQPGDAYIGPTCNNDGTFRTCFYVNGLNLPASNPDYEVTINGTLYPIAFSVVISSTEVVVCVTGIPGDGAQPLSVRVQLAQGCSFFAPSLFTGPVCVCRITGIRLGGQPGDAFIGPTCNNDGTYRSCYYITGLNLPANNPNYQIAIDGIEYPIAFTSLTNATQVIICATGIPADGTQGIPVYVKLNIDCDFSVCPLYNEPFPCPGGSPIFDPTPGPWNIANINNSNGSAVFDPCKITNFTLSAKGFSTPTADKKEMVYQNICGDGEIIIHISSINNPGWAGIVMQEDLTPGSKKAAIKTQLGNFVQRESRVVQNGQVQNQQIFRPQATWLKLTRTGNNFQGFTSVNGQTWQFAFAANIPMVNCIKVGMFVEGINTNTLTTAIFDNVSVSGSVMVQPISPILALETFTEQPTQDLPDFSLYPNPASDMVNIKLDPPANGDVYIYLYTSEGQLLRKQLIEGGLDATVQIAINDLAAGTYLVRIDIDGKSHAKKLLVLAR